MELRSMTTPEEREQMTKYGHVILSGDEPTEQAANEAFENDSSIRAIKDSLQVSFLELAKVLKENRDRKYWETLGYDTFEAYIANPDIGFERSTIYNLIAIYERFVLEYDVQPAGLAKTYYSKLTEILPVVTKDNYEEWLTKAETLSRSDLREEVRSHQGRSPVYSHAETEFGDFVKNNFLEYRISKKGLPDFMVIDANGEVVGFVEVKQSDAGDDLKDDQVLFRDFCRKNKIPYQVWSPNMALDRWQTASDHFKKTWMHATTDIWSQIEKVKKAKDKPVSENGSLINQLLTLWEPINPNYEQFFKVKAQRDAMEWLLNKTNEEFCRYVIGEVLPKIIGVKYAPTITTPVQLQNKLGELRSFIKKEEDGKVAKIY